MISQLGKLIPGMVGVNPQGDKSARAHAIAPQVEAGVYLPGAPNVKHTDYDPSLTPMWVRQLVDECASFPNAAHDDQVDALSQALMRMAGSSASMPLYGKPGGGARRARYGI